MSQAVSKGLHNKIGFLESSAYGPKRQLSVMKTILGRPLPGPPAVNNLPDDRNPKKKRREVGFLASKGMLLSTPEPRGTFFRPSFLEDEIVCNKKGCLRSRLHKLGLKVPLESTAGLIYRKVGKDLKETNFPLEASK